MNKQVTQLKALDAAEQLRLMADSLADKPHAVAEFAARCSMNPVFLMLLFDIKLTDIERRARDYLARRAQETTPRPVRSHGRRQSVPVPEKLEAQKRANMKVAAASAVIMLKIDGREIRDWTIGQAISAGRRKGHESRILSTIGERLKHLKHTDRVGAYLSDRDIQDVVDATKEPAT